MRPLRPSPRSASGPGWALVVAFALAAGSARAVPPYSIEVVDGGPGMEVGEFSSLRLDAQGRPHIAYYDAVLRDLKYAWHDGLAWNLETADPSLDDTGQYAALALDSLDRPHIAYYNATARKAYYTRKVGNAWIREQADTASFDYGWYPSIAFDRFGRPWIASYDQGRGHPRVSTRLLDGRWTGSYVDTTYDLDGYYTSIAIEGVDRPVPHVAYLDATQGSLRYATRPDARKGWQVEVADSSSSGTGFYTSLVVDRFGRVHVSYVDIANGALRYGLRDRTTGRWTHETVDSAPDLLYDCSLALDPTGWPHISYHHGTSSSLRHARRDAAGWHLQTVDDSPGTQGLYTSIECDSLGGVAISYLDGSAFLLKYAHGPSEVTLSAPPLAVAPRGFAVSPNPARASQPVRFAAREPGVAAYELFDLGGRQVARVTADERGTAEWRPVAGPAGGAGAPGMLFARAVGRDGRTRATQRLVIVR